MPFIKRRSRVPKIDPPSGLFIKRDSQTNVYGFAPLDIRIQPRLEITTFETEYGNATVLQSCNDLFLCSVNWCKLCVYNPTLNLFKVLPKPHYSEPYNYTRMAFDPTKSPHYKVVHARGIDRDYRYRIQTYSSETGIWSIVCSCSDPFEDLEDGIYWNDAIHWIDYDCFLHYKLDFGNKTVALTKIQLPVTMGTVDKYCKSLFVSRGCLLLLGMDKTHPKDQLNIYAMRNGHPEWTFKYSVNDLRNRHPEWTFKYFVNNWSTFNYIRRVLCIALGEREEDSFMVIKLDRMVVLYKFVLKTFCELPEFESMLKRGRYSPSTSSFLVTASFASV